MSEATTIVVSTTVSYFQYNQDWVALPIYGEDPTASTISPALYRGAVEDQ